MTIQHDASQPSNQPPHQPPAPYVANPGTYPGMPQGQPHFGHQPQFVPVRKKSKAPLVLGIIAIVMFVVVGGCVALLAAAGSGVDKAMNDIETSVSAAQQSLEQAAPPAGDAAVPAQPEAAPAAGIGAPVRDGKFEFTVTKIEDGPKRIGNEYFGEDAQGRFVLVHVTVQNIGAEAQLFSGAAQKLFDAQGREFSSDTAAAIYLGQDAQSFLNEINPGNQVDGIVVFDLPVDVVPTSIELHDSMFSGGVTVALG